MDNQEQNPNYYGILPADVRYDKNISDGAKILYAEISALSNVHGYCWATNKYFADLYGKHETTISRIVSELGKNGHIRIETTSNKEGSLRKMYPLSKSAMGNSKNAKTGNSKNAKTPLGKNANHNTITNNTIIDNNVSCPVFEKTEPNQLLETHILAWQRPEGVPELLFQSLQYFAIERQGRAKKERMTKRAWEIILKQAKTAATKFGEQDLIDHIESGMVGNWKSPFWKGWDEKMTNRAQPEQHQPLPDADQEANYQRTIAWILKRFEYLQDSKVRQISREEWLDLFSPSGQSYKQFANYFTKEQKFAIFEEMLTKLSTDNYTKKSTLYSHLLKALKEKKAEKVKQRS